MNRPIADLLNQRVRQAAPRVRQFRAHILAVEFPARAFAVTAAGYSGPQRVKATAAIDFGTLARPLVFRGNDCLVEQDDAGEWHATQYLPTNRCVPTTSANVPNVDLPTYVPPKDTATVFEPFSIDTTFSPHAIAMGQIVPSAQMPASTTGGPKLTYLGLGSLLGTGLPLEAQGDLLFIPNNQALVVANLSNPTNPVFAATVYTTTDSDAIKNMLVNGKYLYLLTDDGGTTRRLKILDISAPYVPTLLSSTTIANLVTLDLSITGTWSNTNLVLTTSAPDCQVWNVSTPATPSLTRTITTTGLAPRAIGRYNGLYVLDRSAKTLKVYTGSGATLRGTYAFAGGASPYTFRVIAARQNRTGSKDPESICYVMDTGTSQIYVIDGRDATAPALAYTFYADSTLGAYDGGTTAWTLDCLEVCGGYLFVGGHWYDSGTNAGLLVQHDLTNPLQPVQISRNSDAFYANDYPKRIKPYHNHIYCTSGNTPGIFVYSYT